MTTTLNPIGLNPRTGAFEGPISTRVPNGHEANRLGEEYWKSQRFFYRNGKIRHLKPKIDERGLTRGSYLEPDPMDPTFDYATATAIRESIFGGQLPILALIKHIGTDTVSSEWLKNNGCPVEYIPSANASAQKIRTELLAELKSKGVRIAADVEADFLLTEQEALEEDLERIGVRKTSK